jgi:hypothetical protein
MNVLYVLISYLCISLFFILPNIFFAQNSKKFFLGFLLKILCAFVLDKNSKYQLRKEFVGCLENHKGIFWSDL